MSSKQKSVLIFGGGELQLSILEECRKLSLFTVVIDPDPSAAGKEISDAFEVVDGDDFATTCKVVEKYSIDGIVTAATDKPLMMMAQVAEKYCFPFFSERTAANSTDKHLMKQVFQENGLPCASGKLIDKIDDSLKFPVILKPRDNSGSRGILFCRSRSEAEEGLSDALSFTKKDTILAEEFIDGKEYSVEALHFDSKTIVVQITEKLTTPFPYNVELGHIQPAGLSASDEKRISCLINEIAAAMNFQNCASHTELKINNNGIFLIETSPRLGGDFITSKLTLLSTSINMERELIRIALGENPRLPEKQKNASAIFYFDFYEKKEVTNDLSLLGNIKINSNLVKFHFDLKQGMPIPKIRNSLDRYGFIIVHADSRGKLFKIADKYLNKIKAEV